MAKRIRYTPEQIITKLREAEVYLSQGQTIGQAVKHWRSANKPTTVGVGNMGEWMSPRPGSSKKWKKRIPS